MAKKSPTGNATKLNALLRKARAAAKGVEGPFDMDPASQLVLSFLNFNATRKQSERAYDALMESVVDLHELRVSHPHELVELIGENYPGAYDRVLRLREALHAVYQREHDVSLKTVAGKGKREQRQYFETLPGTPPYVAAQVLLFSFGAHAVPVDDKLCVLLIAEGVMDEAAAPADAESFLAKQIKAGDALDTHLALQAWADKRKAPATPKPATTRVAAKKTTKKKTTTKKAAKKTAAKKTSKKKTTRTAKKK